MSDVKPSDARVGCCNVDPDVRASGVTGAESRVRSLSCWLWRSHGQGASRGKQTVRQHRERGVSDNEKPEDPWLKNEIQEQVGEDLQRGSMHSSTARTSRRQPGTCRLSGRSKTCLTRSITTSPDFYRSAMCCARSKRSAMKIWLVRIKIELAANLPRYVSVTGCGVTPRSSGYGAGNAMTGSSCTVVPGVASADSMRCCANGSAASM
ncbi:hypothetical protein C7413_101331 [Paraburkholderia silvatlantica]|nr:hypothetical protein C7411_101330 [Paraburkholderia silvatlantica]PXW42676.1 hypothetical protein C7413_101331 [Paraburkholderia silvatlantica]